MTFESTRLLMSQEGLLGQSPRLWLCTKIGLKGSIFVQKRFLHKISVGLLVEIVVSKIV
jgi:hypothetical protein